MMVVQMVDY
jgi:hypothetical protein